VSIAPGAGAVSVL